MQLGAARALSEGAPWLETARRSYAEAASLTADALGIGRPAGGTFVFFDVAGARREGESTLDLLERCLDAGVLLTPGAACGAAYEAWVRLCFTSVRPEELEEALDRVAPLLRSPR